eukprot:6182666-Pleurochrysis_carterae.AAC.2
MAFILHYGPLEYKSLSDREVAAGTAIQFLTARREGENLRGMSDDRSVDSSADLVSEDIDSVANFVYCSSVFLINATDTAYTARQPT